jgi:septal ring factor EnvC (AmiA/AmiB activator)
MSVTIQTEPEWKSPLRKLTRFFERSRDRWKAKHQELKRERKGMENQIRAVEKSRAMWTERAARLEQRVAELERELEGLKKTSV